MAAISVRDLDDHVAALLKVRAARHGRSMEAEARAILTDAVIPRAEDQLNFAQAIRERFDAVEDVDTVIPGRSELPRAAELPDRR
ncbi:plasmid stabilization protein [Pseudonocardia nematodicida]|uniref:Plasmid stabilization protein n=1 Tax=Pseudonocardia nematodicida TaxID=1206997 RepID=A0ABV1KHU6_9PSEU